MGSSPRAKERRPRSFSSPSRMYLMIVVLIIFTLSLSVFVNTILKAHPEVLMVTNSQCSNPVQNWNGKVMGIPVWTNWLARVPPHHNIHYRANLSSGHGVESGANLNDDSLRRRTMTMDTGSIQSVIEPRSFRHLMSDGFGSLKATNLRSSAERAGYPTKRSVIIWGTHHRTGTYLAQKVFSTICSHMKWCCLFHPTRSSLAAIRDSLSREKVVHLFGHNQWIWNPREVLGDRVSYKFVHFYRNPIQKIVSGYLFHRDGGEAWNRRPGHFSSTCDTADSIKKADKAEGAVPSMDEVYDYCQAVHLCETCCRMAHEVKGDESQTTTTTTTTATATATARYKARAVHEYAFICENLGKKVASRPLRTVLRSLPLTQGLLVEAALDYYENLRMISLLRETRGDPDTLHVNVDDVYFEHESIIRRILEHIHLGLSRQEHETLVHSLNFYNLRDSWYYKLTMNSPLQTHVYSPGLYAARNNSLLVQSGHMKSALMGEPEFVTLYAPILAMLKESET